MPEPESQPSPAAKVNTAVESAIRRHGSAENALAVVMGQNLTYETQAETDQTTIRDLRTKVPDPEKMVVLPKERAELLNKYETLKLTPEQVTAAVAERDTLKGTVSTHSIEKLSREGAPAIGFDPDATADLVASKGLHLELREVEVEVEKNGKKEKVKQRHPFVRPAADDKAQLVPLTEYAKTLPAFEQRALKAAPTTPQTSTGIPYVEQRPAATTGSGDAVGEFLTTRNQRAQNRPTPFAPPRQPAAAAS